MSKTAIAQRLKLARFAAGWQTARAFSDKYEIPQSTYSLHESGGRGLDEETAERYAALLGNCTAGWLLRNDGPGPMDQLAGADRKNPIKGELAEAPVDLCYVVGTVEAGAWREAVELPQEEWEPVYWEDRPEFRGARRFGLRVRGPSMNEVYPPGTILDCVSFFDISRAPRDGDHVIVYRRGPGNLIEATVKQLIRNGEKWELRPRSTHPAFQQPIALPGIPDDDENEDIRVVALVIGAYRRNAV